jgi:hypothetical protein
MGKFVSFIKSLFFAVKVIATAIAAPVTQLVRTTWEKRPISVGQLLFAIWRLFVWAFFVLCVTASVGVPAVIAYLFLVDLAIVGVQIVSVAAINVKEKLA